MIQILSVNNDANKEQSMAYDEASLLDGTVLVSDNALRGDGRYKLIVRKEAVEEIFSFFEWEKGRRLDRRNEQGGILVGDRYYDAEKDIHFAVVTKAIPAEKALGDSGSLEMTPECWVDMHTRKDEYETRNGVKTVILGWFHSHPNGLPCFMSGTDRTTQNKFFPGDNVYAVVMNPQRHLVKAYRSCECYDTQAFFITDGKDRDHR